MDVNVFHITVELSLQWTPTLELPVFQLNPKEGTFTKWLSIWLFGITVTTKEFVFEKLWNF